MKTSLGKVDCPREFYITTDGLVRDSVLDELKNKAQMILTGQLEDNGTLPFICKIDEEEEVKEKDNWFKANPSLRYRPSLLKQIEKEYEDYKLNPYANISFMIKRMNLPKAPQDAEVTSWENILATKEEVPIEQLKGADCVVGIDYSKVNDMIGACILFRKNSMYYAILHGWFCTNSRDKEKIKAPLEEWEQRGLLTIVDDVEIDTDLVCEWIQEQLQDFNFKKIGIDNFRFSLLSKSLKKIGIDCYDKSQMKMIRPSDIMKIVPVIDSLFNQQQIAVGDNPLFRWCVNNTKLVSKGQGNYYYDKIEPKARKTDLFMAFVHAVIASQDTLDDDVDLIFINPIIF